MKARLWHLVVFLVGGYGLFDSALGAEQFSGLIIYMDPPIGTKKIAESIPYSRVERQNIAESLVVLLNGETRQIENAGIIGVFQMPGPKTPSPQAVEEKANEVIGNFPSVRSTVQAFLQRYRQAQADATRRPQTATRPQAASSGAKLSVNGFTYRSVTLESMDGDVVKVFHSEGIANLPLALLTKEQIALLNSTSSTVHIDADWVEKKKLADADRARRLEQEIQRATQLAANKRQELITKGHQFEEAARYEDALESYREANAKEDLKRVAGSIAADFEKRKDYQAAADYFEKAELYAEAGRIRKTYNMSESVSSSHLSSEEIFRHCAPATVSIVTEELRGIGVGSGFFVRKGGYILTNHHVVAQAQSISVVMDKNEYSATVVVDSKTPDLAVLKIDLAEHPVLEFADSNQVQPGAPAFAIGTPKALPKSITGGMISAVDRTFLGNSVFQMSVLINHGNSGGPLLNDSGKVIGIATFGEGTAGVVDGVAIGSDIQGINYAIKANEARSLLSRLPK